MFNSVLNVLLLRKFRFNLVKRKFLETLQSEIAEEFLELLLKLMGFMFYIDKNYRRNIENFNAKLTFKDKSGNISLSVIYKDAKMKTIEGQIDNPNATIIFKDQKTLMNFLLSPKIDALSTLLNQSITFEGNLNYLSKFAYMSTHLRLMITS